MLRQRSCGLNEEVGVFSEVVFIAGCGGFLTQCRCTALAPLTGAVKLIACSERHRCGTHPGTGVVLEAGTIVGAGQTYPCTRGGGQTRLVLQVVTRAVIQPPGDGTVGVDGVR